MRILESTYTTETTELNKPPLQAELRSCAESWQSSSTIPGRACLTDPGGIPEVEMKLWLHSQHCEV